MRQDGRFIAVDVDDARVAEAGLAARLTEVCPVDIYADADGTVQLVQGNLDECVLCGLCLDASGGGRQASAVRVLKLYDGEAALA